MVDLAEPLSQDRRLEILEVLAALAPMVMAILAVALEQLIRGTREAVTLALTRGSLLLAAVVVQVELAQR